MYTQKKSAFVQLIIHAEGPQGKKIISQYLFLYS